MVKEFLGRPENSHVQLHYTPTHASWLNQTESWMTSHDSDFLEKAGDVCGLYLDPPENAMAWSVDEKTGIQAKSRVNPTWPAVPAGHIETDAQAARGRPVRQEFE